MSHASRILAQLEMARDEGVITDDELDEHRRELASEGDDEENQADEDDDRPGNAAVSHSGP